MSADFAAHWAQVIMPALHRRARLLAIKLVTAAEDDLSWENYAAALEQLEHEAHRLGAGYMPIGHQIELHEALKRSLVDSIGAVLQPWAEAQTTAAIVGVDVARWNRQVKQWAGFLAPPEQSGQPGADT
jgi:hypothetical protein